MRSWCFWIKGTGTHCIVTLVWSFVDLQLWCSFNSVFYVAITGISGRYSAVSTQLLALSLYKSANSYMYMSKSFINLILFSKPFSCFCMFFTYLTVLMQGCPGWCSQGRCCKYRLLRPLPRLPTANHLQTTWRSSSISSSRWFIQVPNSNSRFCFSDEIPGSGFIMCEHRSSVADPHHLDADPDPTY